MAELGYSHGISAVRPSNFHGNRPRGVEVSATVPEEVRDWHDKQAAASFKTRSRYLRDLLVNIYRREHNVGT